jgi:hypothetical protein
MFGLQPPRHISNSTISDLAKFLNSCKEQPTLNQCAKERLRLWRNLVVVPLWDLCVLVA